MKSQEWAIPIVFWYWLEINITDTDASIEFKGSVIVWG